MIRLNKTTPLLHGLIVYKKTDLMVIPSCTIFKYSIHTVEQLGFFLYFFFFISSTAGKTIIFNSIVCRKQSRCSPKTFFFNSSCNFVKMTGTQINFCYFCTCANKVSCYSAFVLSKRFYEYFLFFCYSSFWGPLRCKRFL